jgi:hypothetical protein
VPKVILQRFHLLHLYNFGFQLSRQSVTVERGTSETVELSLTIPLPCTVNSSATDVDTSCPLHFEMLVPSVTGACESTLTAKDKCGIEIYPSKWNKPHPLKIIHNDNGKYHLTPSEVERKVYLRTFNYAYAKAWTGVELPVINVIIKLFHRFPMF